MVQEPVSCSGALRDSRCRPGIVPLTHSGWTLPGTPPGMIKEALPEILQGLGSIRVASVRPYATLATPSRRYTAGMRQGKG